MNSHDPQFPSSANLYQLTFENREHYLYAYVKGNHDGYEISVSFWRDLAVECERLGCRKLLIEEDIVEPLSMSDTYRLATMLPTLGFRGVTIAFIDRYAEHKESNEFGELVATNRGFYVKAFDNFEEGESWLLGL